MMNVLGSGLRHIFISQNESYVFDLKVVTSVLIYRDLTLSQSQSLKFLIPEVNQKYSKLLFW